MIEYVGRSGPPMAMSCPAFICDACRTQVLSKDGNVFWVVRHTGDERQSSPLFISHKGTCALQVEALLEWHFPQDEGWSVVLSEEASVFARHLANNLTRSFDDDLEGEYHQHELVMPIKEASPNS